MNILNQLPTPPEGKKGFPWTATSLDSPPQYIGKVLPKISIITPSFNQGVFIGNPKLKSARAIDYEVGFQQMLTKTSALKVQTYYKEMRDQIQEQNRNNE